jgi:uroporphyrinogen-III synthase
LKVASSPLLLVTRPAEEAERMLVAAESAGFTAMLAPLLRIVALEWDACASDHDALLFTSARAPGPVAAQRPNLRALPAWCVGGHSAGQAREAGFTVAATGSGDGSAIVAAAAASGVRRLLHLGGESRAPMAVPEGLIVTHVPVYAARAIEHLPANAAEALAAHRVLATLLYSPRSARLFRQLLEGLGLDPADQRIVALSEAVAEAAGPGWRAREVASAPTTDAALAAATSVWHGARHG